MIHRRPRYLLILLATSALAATPGQAASPTTALLRVHGSYAQGAHGLVLYDQDFFVARDRSTTAVASTSFVTQPFNARWTTTQRSSTSTVAAYQALQRGLVEGRVGFRSGVCTVNDTVGPVSGSLEVRWYAASGPRFAEFTIVFGDPIAAPCDEDTRTVLRAIQAFAASTGASVGPGINP